MSTGFVSPMAPLPLSQESALRLGLSFEIGISEGYLRANPGSRDALEMLGHALTRCGRHEDALRIDLRLVSLQPDNAFVHYNLACSLSNLGKVEEALTALEKALILGYDDLPFMEKDPDLAKVRKDPRFRKLMGSGKRRR